MSLLTLVQIKGRSSDSSDAFVGNFVARHFQLRKIDAEGHHFFLHVCFVKYPIMSFLHFQVSPNNGNVFFAKNFFTSNLSP